MTTVKFSLKEQYIPRWLFNLIATVPDLDFLVMGVYRNKMQLAFNHVVAPKQEHLAKIMNFTKRGALTFRFKSEIERDDFIKYWSEKPTPSSPLGLLYRIG
jgi:hypothetical protein